MIRKILKSWRQKQIARDILKAIRICVQQLPEERLKPSVKAILAIYDQDGQAYQRCLMELKHAPSHKEKEDE